MFFGFGATKQRCSGCKGEVWLFKQLVHEDDELAHASGDGHEWFLSGRAQAVIKLFEDAVISHRAQRGHVERGENRAATAADVAHAFLSAAVTVVRRDAGQCRSGLAIELSEFGHFRQDGGRDHRANAGNGIQPLGFVSQHGILGNDLGDGLIALFDLFLQRPVELPSLPTTQWIAVMFGPVGFNGERVDELAAALG